MNRLLLTGFEPFHKASSNPTQEIVRILETEKIPNVITAVLPVEFGRSVRIVCRLIDEVKPDVVIALGQAEGRTDITPEKIAINLDHARIPDNAGNMPNNVEIISGGADGLFSTLPVDEIVEKLKNADIPTSISYSAGTFVCNYIFYAIQNHCKPLHIQSGFVHVPLMDSQASEFPGLPTIPLNQMVEAVKLMIKIVP